MLQTAHKKEDAWRRALKALPSSSTGGRPDYILVPVPDTLVINFIRCDLSAGLEMRSDMDARSERTVLLTVTHFHQPHRYLQDTPPPQKKKNIHKTKVIRK